MDFIIEFYRIVFRIVFVIPYYYLRNTFRRLYRKVFPPKMRLYFISYLIESINGESEEVLIGNCTFEINKRIIKDISLRETEDLLLEELKNDSSNKDLDMKKVTMIYFKEIK